MRFLWAKVKKKKICKRNQTRKQRKQVGEKKMLSQLNFMKKIRRVKRKNKHQRKRQAGGKKKLTCD